MVGVHRDTPYGWLERERLRGQGTPFADALLRAKEQLADTYEEHLFERARSEKGMPGVVSSIFMLKALRPDTYRETVQVKHSGTVWNASVDLTAMSPDERAQLIELALMKAREQIDR